MGLTAGTRLGPYELVAPLGAGGMGDVYRAIDTRLSRTVALKVIGDAVAGRDEWRHRFIKEARAASAFNHPHIVTIHEVDTVDGVDFIVMELVAGRSLEQVLRADTLSIDTVLAHAEQIASALEAAHAAGIVHRDIKPSNVMVSDTGHVKVLDFGIAKELTPAIAPDARTASLPDATRAGTVIGSAAYMSPEQAQGKPVDGKSDVFSVGVVLYEMLAGRRPFGGDTPVEIVARILEAEPPPIKSLRHDAPAALVALLRDCLEKDRARRPSAREVLERLTAIRHTRTAEAGGLVAMLRRRVVALPAVLTVAAIVSASGFWWMQGREARQARARVPELMQLGDQSDFVGFYHAARTIVPLLPEDVRLRQMWIDMTMEATFDSAPSGAEAWIRGYSESEEKWLSIGRTPVDRVRVPFGLSRLKLVKEGYVPVEVFLIPLSFTYTLDPKDAVPDGMGRIPAIGTSLEGTAFSLPSFWMDRLEVTNRQFKAFVDAGGYRQRDYWVQPFERKGRHLSWEEAMGLFRDRTGRAGPSTWELGTYPEGQADFPVGGVSWYEAAAYAVFAGKSLPTGFQWRAAAGFASPAENFRDILTLSNFGMTGPAAAGSYHGMGPWGHLDLAGNVKEWCWNESGDGRLILGGGWNEPVYMFSDRDAQPALDRLPTYGFRLVKNIDAPEQATLAPVQRQSLDGAQHAPVDDAGFEILRSLFSFDATPLETSIERTEETPDWTHQVVTFNAAYGGERVMAHVYLPKQTAPPFQPIVYFPGGDASLLGSSRELRLTETQFVIRSGRALVYPVYKGTFERSAGPTGPNGFRDLTIARGKDFRRVIDFIETRTDLDRGRIGFYGLSLGAFNGIIFSTIEPRLKASVLMGTGFSMSGYTSEINSRNFAPYVHIPTLMINGRNDFTYPVATAQIPLFTALGTPAEHKRHAILEGGHQPLEMHLVMREVLDWFDRYLGPVTPATAVK